MVKGIWEKGYRGCALTILPTLSDHKPVRAEFIVAPTAPVAVDEEWEEGVHPFIVLQNMRGKDLLVIYSLAVCSMPRYYGSL